MKYANLDNTAKERARQWWLSCFDHDQWWDTVYDDACQCGALLGLEFDENDLAFSGFWSQGDGASFQGCYTGTTNVLPAIKEHAPLDETLHAIAAELDALNGKRRLLGLGGVSASITRVGRYSHSGTMNINADCEEGDDDELDEATERAYLTAFRSFADWIYRQLEREYEYLTSIEAVEESIEASDYDFDESGSIL